MRAGRTRAGAGRATTGRSSPWLPGGVPKLLEVDTSYFIGNAPGQVRISVADGATASLADAGSRRFLASLPDDHRRLLD